MFSLRRLSPTWSALRAPHTARRRDGEYRASTSESASHASATARIKHATRPYSVAPGYMTAFWPYRPCQASSPCSTYSPMLPTLYRTSGAWRIKVRIFEEIESHRKLLLMRPTIATVSLQNRASSSAEMTAALFSVLRAQFHSAHAKSYAARCLSETFPFGAAQTPAQLSPIVWQSRPIKSPPS